MAELANLLARDFRLLKFTRQNAVCCCIQHVVSLRGNHLPAICLLNWMGGLCGDLHDAANNDFLTIIRINLIMPPCHLHGSHFGR
jgi:hypothetical protein